MYLSTTMISMMSKILSIVYQILKGIHSIVYQAWSQQAVKKKDKLSFRAQILIIANSAGI